MALLSRRAEVAAMRSAWPTRFERRVGPPFRRRSPLMRVPGASPSHEQKCPADGNRDRSTPTSAATVSAVSRPMVGIASRSTPSIRFSRRRSSRSRPLRERLSGGGSSTSFRASPSSSASTRASHAAICACSAS